VALTGAGGGMTFFAGRVERDGWHLVDTGVEGCVVGFRRRTSAGSLILPTYWFCHFWCSWSGRHFQLSCRTQRGIFEEPGSGIQRGKFSLPEMSRSVFSHAVKKTFSGLKSFAALAACGVRLSPGPSPCRRGESQPVFDPEPSQTPLQRGADTVPFIRILIFWVSGKVLYQNNMI